MLASGLRGSEIEVIKPEDVTVNDGIIKIIIADRTVEVSDDDYLAKELVQLIGYNESGKRLFYSDNTLKNKASEKGLKCSDLRRAFLERDKLK